MRRHAEHPPQRPHRLAARCGAGRQRRHRVDRQPGARGGCCWRRAQSDPADQCLRLDRRRDVNGGGRDSLGVFVVAGVSGRPGRHLGAGWRSPSLERHVASRILGCCRDGGHRRRRGLVWCGGLKLNSKVAGACGIEQTNRCASSEARRLESRHAQIFAHIARHATDAASVHSLAFAVSHAEPTPRATALDLCAFDWAPAVARASSASDNTSAQDRAFIALQNAYRAHGGLSCLRSLSVWRCALSEGSGRDVEDLIAAGELFSFHWYHAM